MMVSRDEYFAINQCYLESRKVQLFSLIGFLRKHVNLCGDVLVSVGCGVAADLALLSTSFKHKIGIDTNPSILDFCKSVQSDPEFYQTNHISFLDTVQDDSIDCILALDIDTGIPPLDLLRFCKDKLKKGGCLILTERESNQIIYRRLLLNPLIDKLVLESGNRILSFSRFNPHPVMDDRDNLVVIYKK